MITQEQLQRYDAYFVKHNIGVLFVMTSGESHVIAHFADCNRRYAISLLDDAMAQGLHPLAIFHDRLELNK